MNVSNWESAYLRFETSDQEVKKFCRRLRLLGESDWPRQSRTVELFCGRGNGLVALTKLGFQQVEGVDLSPRLLAQYEGKGKTYVADCRLLPFADSSRDVVVIQGGLHHLENLPGDLTQVLSEVHRVLAPAGRIVIVEPWKTPFLRFVHFVAKRQLLRMLSPKLSALATMIELEGEIYESWLAHSGVIESEFRKIFTVEIWRTGFGKLSAVGTK